LLKTDLHGFEINSKQPSCFAVLQLKLMIFWNLQLKNVSCAVIVVNFPK